MQFSDQNSINFELVEGQITSTASSKPWDLKSNIRIYEESQVRRVEPKDLTLPGSDQEDLSSQTENSISQVPSNKPQTNEVPYPGGAVVPQEADPQLRQRW